MEGAAVLDILLCLNVLKLRRRLRIRDNQLLIHKRRSGLGMFLIGSVRPFDCYKVKQIENKDKLKVRHAHG